MRPYCHVMLLLPLIACEGNSRTSDTATSQTDTVSSAKIGERTYRAQWIIGEDPDKIDSTTTSRFRLRVSRFRSGILTVQLDTAPTGTSGRRAHFTLADSISVVGLTPMDKFTQGCKSASGLSRPIIGVLADTVNERSRPPRLAWLLDTVRVRITKVSPDSISCFNASPD